MKVLRDYQRECIESVYSGFASAKSGVAVLPTGSGKTVICSGVIAQWPTRNEWTHGNVLFLAHRKELIEQSAAAIAAEVGVRPHIEMGLQSASLDSLWTGDMTVVASVQTMMSSRRLEKYKNHPFGLIIVDECHHATAASYRRVLDYFRTLNPELRVFGVTATPNRSDETALGLVFESVFFERTINDMRDQGWLVPFDQQTVTVQSLNLDTIKVRKKSGHEADFSRDQLEEALTQDRVLHEMATPILRECADIQAIIFTAGVCHAHRLADILNAHRPSSAAAIDGDPNHARDREDAVRRYRVGQLQYLLNFGVATEGFDAPHTAAVVMARPTKSVSLYTQMMGRGLRPLPGVVDGIQDPFERRMAILNSPKHKCLILDFVGASRNGVVDCYDVLGGNYDVEVRQLASEHARTGHRVDINTDDLELAKSIIDLRRALSDRVQIVVESEYTLQQAELRPHSQTKQTEHRGGASDSQVSLLVKLGVARETALSYTYKQASAVIDRIGATRCTDGQRRALEKHGVNCEGMGMQRAGKILDRLAACGWRMPAGGLQELES